MLLKFLEVPPRETKSRKENEKLGKQKVERKRTFGTLSQEMGNKEKERRKNDKESGKKKGEKVRKRKEKAHMKLLNYRHKK
ncbi:TPA: hypothetical protein HA351_11015 [Methanosarcinaceae archaeon]|nr:hypothetical protein [Methanosarcinaceae archaeon]